MRLLVYQKFSLLHKYIRIEIKLHISFRNITSLFIHLGIVKLSILIDVDITRKEIKYSFLGCRFKTELVLTPTIHADLIDIY